MPNRILKESICYSADIDRLTPFEETVFYRILVRADDYGNLDGRFDFLKSVLFTTKPGVSAKKIKVACEKLAEVGLIQGYEVDGKPYYHVVNFRKHQRLRNKHGKVPQPAASCGELPPELELELKLEQELELELPDLFERFWQAYPKKIGRREAMEAFVLLKPDARTVGQMVGAVERMKCQDAWLRENGRFIPSAEKWLRDQRWNDGGGDALGVVI